MSKESKVPSSRMQRVAKLGGLAAQLLGNTLTRGAKQLLHAQKPSTKTTLLTASNATAIADKLAQMRGAAMKVGQLISLDAGEFLPPEWEPIMARLRQGADHMPKAQLLYMLKRNWGDDWMSQFRYFSFEPLASASIGQVHKAQLQSGEWLAIKVQYPGVSESIESDLSNLKRLLSLSGLVPKTIDIDRLIQDATEQLKQEADYRQEAQFLNAYHDCIKHDERFVIPRLYEQLSNRHILAMSFEEGIAIDKLKDQSQKNIDQICTALMELTLAELFDYQLMQSDPNFANYFYQAETGKIVLLDFGACCRIEQHNADNFRAMARAMQQRDPVSIKHALLALSLLHQDMPEDIQEIIIHSCITASECLQSEHYNFKQQALIQRLYAQSQALMGNKNAATSPQFDVALVNRKISGMILLANRLGASLPMRQSLAHYIN